MTTTIITVEIDGETLTLKQLAERCGVGYETIRCRYSKGDRGERLSRPLENHCAVPPRSADIDETQNVMKQRERIKRERKRVIREQSEKALADARAAHKTAFSQPLIARDLLSEDERREIQERVSFCGQRCWSISGGS